MAISNRESSSNNSVNKAFIELNINIYYASMWHLDRSHEDFHIFFNISASLLETCFGKIFVDPEFKWINTKYVTTIWKLTTPWTLKLNIPKIEDTQHV